MDLVKTIQALRQEKESLERAIASLEELMRTGGSITTGRPGGIEKSRGRKSMPAEERQVVSERMKRHWASRRKLRRKPAQAGE